MNVGITMKNMTFLFAMLISATLLPAQTTTFSQDQVRGLPELILSIIEMEQRISLLEQTVADQGQEIEALQQAGAPSWTSQQYLLDQTQTDFGLMDTPISPVKVYRNGARQTIGVDYELNGGVVHFIIEAAPGKDDLIIIEYQVAGAPAPIVGNGIGFRVLEKGPTKGDIATNPK